MKHFVEKITMFLVHAVFGQSARILDENTEFSIREEERNRAERMKALAAEEARQMALDFVDQALCLTGETMTVDALAGNVMTLAQESSDKLARLDEQKQAMLDRHRAELEGLLSTIRAEDKQNSERKAVLEGLRV